MKIITISLAIVLWLLPQITLQAQEVVVSIEHLETSKEKIIKEEKAELKKEVKRINNMLEANEIDQAQADDLKAEAAQKHALNIENRIAGAINTGAFFYGFDVFQPDFNILLIADGIQDIPKYNASYLLDWDIKARVLE